MEGRGSLDAWLDSSRVEAWVAEHRAGARDRSYELFALLVLERWAASNHFSTM